MSDYTYSDPDGDTLRFLTSTHGGRVILIAKGEFAAKEIYIPTADAHTVAAELLKAAGYAELAGLIETAAQQIAQKAEAEAAEKKLQERRDALSLQLNGGGAELLRVPYTNRTVTMRQAIDRIIELEDKLAAK